LVKLSEGFSFGPFELRTRSRELFKHGVKLKLRPQPFQILNELLGKPGELVTREELRDKLWSSQTFVDFEQSLNTSVKELRAVIGDSATEPQYIETVPRLGYRFIAAVRALQPAAPNGDSAASIAAADPVLAEVPAKKPRAWPRLWAAAVMAAALLTVVGYMKFATSAFGRSAKAYRPPNHAAIEPYLRGRAMLDAHSISDIGRGFAQFQEAIREDPDFAPPYAALGRMYWLLSSYGVDLSETLPLMKSASDKALELDDHLADGHAVRGLVLLYLQNDWHGAEAEFHRALELNPGESAAHDYYATSFLLHTGRMEESIEESQRAVELNPLSVHFASDLGSIYYYARRYPESEAQLRRVLEVDPNLPSAKWALMKLYEQQQRWPEASAQFQEVLAGVNNEPVLSGNADAHTVLSPKKYWSARIEMQQAIVKDIADYCDLAIAYARAGDKEKALGTLELAARKNNAALKDLNIEPGYDSIRNEPRFQQLVAKMNFPHS
jgi:DNA-binding winged helix-turn-helix (wHTH) protein/Flp pilus assembly protein TadD